MEQGGNKSGHTKFDVMKPFSGSGMSIGRSIGPKRGHLVAICGSGGIFEHPRRRFTVGLVHVNSILGALSKTF